MFQILENLYKKSKINVGSLPFIGVHLVCFAAFWLGVDWTAFWMCIGLFLVRKFGITGGYHRYFSHRSYQTSRWFQFVLAVLGGMATQRGAIWWAAHHRHHHKHSDTANDIHSAKEQGFYWSHVGWVMCSDFDEYDERTVKDLTKYPELVWLAKWHVVPGVSLAVTCFLVHGWLGLLWGYFISTVILYHTTFAINSLCHVFGTQRYDTGEESKNCWWLAIMTLGEGWHNNHHHYQLSCRQGFFWWEIDITYYVLVALSWVGVVWDLKQPPERFLQPEAFTAMKAS